MSEDRSLEGFARSAGTNITGPGFEALARTATRRRRSAIVASACAALAISGVVGVGLQSIASDRSGPAGPSPSPTAPTSAPSPTTPTEGDDLSGQQIVDDPRAGQYRFVASPEDPDVKASVWAYCATITCKRHVAAVAVTDDDFATATYLRVRWLTDVTWVSGDSFIIRRLDGQLAMVSASGEMQPITESTDAAPLQADDLLVGDYANGPTAPYAAVDPQSLTSHPLAIPYKDEFLHLFRHGDTTIWGTSDQATIVSSPDGGATWRTEYSTPGDIPLGVVPTPGEGPLAVVQQPRLGDPSAILRSEDAGQTWDFIHPIALLDCTIMWTAVTPSGQFLAYAYPGPARDCQLSPGIYASNSDSWTTFDSVAVSGPPGFVGAGAPLSITVDAAGQSRLYVSWSQGTLVSDDFGRTWRLTPEK